MSFGLIRGIITAAFILVPLVVGLLIAGPLYAMGWVPEAIGAAIFGAIVGYVCARFIYRVLDR